MRKGSAVKAAVATVLQKTWSAAKVSGKLSDLTVTFSGQAAYMSKVHNSSMGLSIRVVLPDLDDNRLYSDKEVNRIVAMALHELAHGYFTDDRAWESVLDSNLDCNREKQHGLHRCINAMEDVRIERQLIDSGFAAGSGSLLPVLLQHMVKDATVETFKLIANVPFAICVNGRGYGVSVSHLLTKWVDLIDEFSIRSRSTRSTAEAAALGLELFLRLQQQKEEQKKEERQQKQGKGQEQGQDGQDGDDRQQQDDQQQQEEQSGQQEEQKKEAGGGHGSKGDKVFEIEPDLSDLPLSETAGVEEICEIDDGVDALCADSKAKDPLPQIGRLAFELRSILDNSSHEQRQRRLHNGRLTRNWGAINRGDEDVFERRRIEEGIDSAVLIALDQSGSMIGAEIHHAAIAVRMLVAALERCPGVATEVRGFASDNYFFETSRSADGTVKRSSFTKASWLVVKKFAESSGVFDRRAGGLTRLRGSTPEVAALNDCLRIASRRPEQRKIVIWIGDGVGYSAEAILALQAKYRDVTVIGIGVGVDLSKYFPHSVKVKKAEDLGRASFKTVVKALAA